jgi:hypothetical protein
VGLSATIIFFVLLASTFVTQKKRFKMQRDPGWTSGLLTGLFKYLIAMESPLIGGFVEKNKLNKKYGVEWQND